MFAFYTHCKHQRFSAVFRGYKMQKNVLKMQKMLLEFLQYSQENTCVWSLFLIKLRETPTQVLSREYCKSFKYTYFEKHVRTTASGNGNLVRHRLKRDFVTGVLLRIIQLHQHRDSNTHQYSFFIELM